VVVLDSESIDRLRSMTPREAVEAGVLTWDQIEEYERY